MVPANAPRPRLRAPLAQAPAAPLRTPRAARLSRAGAEPAPEASLLRRVALTPAPPGLCGDRLGFGGTVSALGGPSRLCGDCLSLHRSPRALRSRLPAFSPCRARPCTAGGRRPRPLPAPCPLPHRRFPALARRVLPAPSSRSTGRAWDLQGAKAHADTWPGLRSGTSLGKPPRSPRGCARWPTGARSREQAAVHLRPPWRVTGTAERVGRLSPPSHFLAVSENSSNARGLEAAMPGSPSFLSRRCPSLHPGKAGGWSLLDQ